MNKTGREILKALRSKDFETADSLIRSARHVHSITIEDNDEDFYLIDAVIDRYDRRLIPLDAAARLVALIMKRGGFRDYHLGTLYGLLPGCTEWGNTRGEVRRAKLAVAMIGEGIPRELADDSLYSMLEVLKRRQTETGQQPAVLRVIEALLKAGADPNASLQQNLFEPLMQLAAETGSEKVIKLMYRHGGDLLEAVSGGYPLGRAARLAGGSLEALDPQEPGDRTLTALSGMGLLTTLLTRDSSLESDSPWVTPNRLKEVRQLIEAGIDVNVADSQGQLPLVRACALSDDPRETAKIVGVLLDAGASPDRQEREGCAALHLVCERIAESCLWELLPAKDEPRSRAYQAALRGQKALRRMLDLLLDAGANPNKPSSKADGHRTPLHVVAEELGRGSRRWPRRKGQGNTRDLEPLRQVTDRLLAAGADPNTLDSCGKTPLIVLTSPAKWNWIIEAMVEFWLEAGFDPSLRDKSGRAAYHYAAKHRSGPRAVELMREHSPLAIRTMTDALLMGGRDQVAELAENQPVITDEQEIQDAFLYAVYLQDRQSADWLLEHGADAISCAESIRKDTRPLEDTYPLWLIQFFAKLKGYKSLSKFAKQAIRDEKRSSAKRVLERILAKTKGADSARKAVRAIKASRRAGQEEIRRKTGQFVKSIRSLFKDLRKQGIFAVDIYNRGWSLQDHAIDIVADKFDELPEKRRKRFLDETGEARYCFTDTKYFRLEAKGFDEHKAMREAVTSGALFFFGGKNEVTRQIGDEIRRLAPKHGLEVEWNEEPGAPMGIALKGEASRK